MKGFRASPGPGLYWQPPGLSWQQSPGCLYRPLLGAASQQGLLLVLPCTSFSFGLELKAVALASGGEMLVTYEEIRFNLCSHTRQICLITVKLSLNLMCLCVCVHDLDLALNHDLVFECQELVGDECSVI